MFFFFHFIVNGQNPVDTILVVDSVIKTVPKDSLKSNEKAIESRVEYNSVDSIVFDVNSKVVKTYGKGTVTYQTIDLQSEYIELDLTKSEIFAKGLYDTTSKSNIGDPVYKDATETFDSDSMRYNFKSKQGLAFGIFTKQEDGYLHGGRTKIHANKEIHILHGKYTTCDEKCPHFYIELSKGKVIPNDKILFGPAWLVVDEIPIPIVIPFGYFPIKKGRSNGIIIPTVGEETSKGFYFRNMGLYFGMGDYMDLKWTGDVYTLGSWRSNVRSNYIAKYKFTGNLDVGYSSLVDDEVRQAPSYNIKWMHSQDAKSMKNASFSANVNYGSVGYARQNSNVQSEYLNNSISSSVSYSKRFPSLYVPFNFNASLDHRQNNIDSTIYLTLPNLRFSVSQFSPLKRKVLVGKTRFYERITLSYSADMQNKLSGAKMDSTLYTKETWDSFEKGIQHYIPIGTSFNLLKFLTISPSFNYTERWYGEKTEKYWDSDLIQYTSKDTIVGGVATNTIPGFNRVYNYSFNIGCNTNIYGMYVFRNNYVKAIRHVLTPTISYGWTPDFTVDKYGYYGTYQSDAEGTIDDYSYYDKKIYGTPNTRKQSAINVTIANVLEAKVRDKNDTITGFSKMKLIEGLSISGSYNFAADSLQMSLINVGGYTTLFKRLKIRYSATLDPYALGVKEINNKKDLVRTDSYMLDKYGTLWRKTDDNWNTSVGYSFGPIKDDKDIKRTGEYAYWDVPWNLSLNYSIRMPRKYYYDYNNQLDSVSSTITQTLSASGKFSLSKNWNITASTGWDFEDKGISYTSIDVYRDLHCWEMSFNWVPLGERQRWEFTLRVKADMLKDLKYEMRSQTNYF